MDSLFPAPSPFDRDAFQARLAALATERIYFGGSSWKYEGWLDQIYSRQRYLSRGRFSKKLFEETCLAEYAAVFPAVCGDFAFYQFPTPEFWAKLFRQTPPGFQFAFKVPEEITCKVFPTHPRYGPAGGLENPSFLNAEIFQGGFLDALEPYRDQTGPLIFEFGAFPKRALANAAQFVDTLEPFLSALPRGWRYAVEIRNADFLTAEYFECLRGHNVAHVFNAWTRMPELHEQLAIPDAFTADFLVCRALLRQGRAYEDAVRDFSPYVEVRDPNLAARQAIREIVHIAREKRATSFIFINNRLEGNTPGTIVSILDGV